MVFDSMIILHFERLISKFKDDGITKPEEQEISYETQLSGGELLELRLLDTDLLDTFGSKSIARHKFWQLLESS